MRRLLSLAVALTISANVAAQTQQNVAKGFSVDKSYTIDDFDSISTFNGNLGVHLPIGGKFTVSSALSYQLGVVYGGNVWSFEVRDGLRPAYTQSGWEVIYVDQANLGPITNANTMCNVNAGIGWTFTLGYIDKCSQDSVHPAYVSADGARHLFFNILNPEDVPANGVLYTRDGSYLRMTYPDAATTQIEFPDGGRHRFDARGRLTAMLDRFGNTVTVSYAPGPNCATDSADCAEDWTISDGFRQHKVDMRRISQSAQASSSGASQDLYSFDVVKSVKLSAGTTAEATYTFNYANNDSLTGVSRKLGPRQDCRVPAVILAVVLQNVTLPDGSRYDITTDTGDAAWDAVQGKWIGRFSMAGSGSGSIVGDQCDCPGGLTTTEQCTSPVTAIPGNTFSGHVTKVKRPTGATTEWNYGGYAFPPFVGDGNPCPPHKDITTCNFNVSDRSAVGVTERLEKATNAQGGETILSKRAYAHSFDSALPSVRTTISTYDNLNTSPAVASSSTYYYTTHFARLDTRKSEYGLPYTDLTSAVLPPTETSNPDSGGRYLSTKQFDAAGNLLGYTFVKYASDAQIDNVDESSVNRRVVSERKVQLDSSGTITNEVITDYSDFDGLGHHRVSTTTTGRNSSPTILRVVTTNYNKADSDVDASAFSSGTRPGGYVQFPSTSPWIVNTYSSQTATEDEKTARSLFLFNASTGFLHRRRTLKTIAAGSVAPAMSAVDTLAVFSQTSGNMTAEAYYGGDAPAQALSTTTPLNSLSVPSAAVYSATHSYSAGTLQTSQAVGVSFKFADRIVESATGRVTRSIDPAGVPTDFEYDKLGRLVWSLPTGGAATSYSYGLNPNMVTIQQYDGGKTAALLTRAQVDYDALGRVIREMRRMPNGSFSSRELTYNGRGLVESVTEWVASSSLSATTPRTTNTYDALGRLSTATAPDGSVTTYTYYGGRSVARQTSVATNRTSESLVTTTEVSDDLGRLYQVIEPDTTTTYGYDVTGHLSSVGMSNGATVQNRTFTYDGRGFLKTETHPESGTTNYEYDGRGHVIKRTAAGNTVAGFDYDAAERLKTVTSAGAVLKEFTFDRANSADGIDKSMGKMASATRHNPDAPGGDLVVTETYEYRDPAGRLSSKKTSLSSGETFTDSYSYNKLGAPLTLTYPACVGCSSLTQPPRTITNTYSNGMLTGVSGYASLSYHANGMVNTVAHTNVGGGTVVDRYTVDTTTALARPESITFENFCNDLSAAPLVSKTVASGSPAGLTVSASGATTYQWYERANGTDSAIAGQTSSTLSTTVSSTRQFWVRVGNGTCTVDSTVATVTPTVCAQPPATITAPSTVARAAAASASVAATAGATYAWTISQGGTITSGASTNAITFMVDCATPSVTLSVTVTASCGSTSTASKAVSSGAAVTAALTTSTPVIAQGSSATIHVDLTGTANWTLSWSPSAPSCGAVGASFDCTVSPAGTRSYTLTATDANGCSASSAPLQITVTPPAPQSLTATATSSTSVQLTWTYSGTAADSYEVQRQAAGGGFVADGPAVTTTSIVRAAAANGAYLYRVRAVKGGTPSAWSVVDLATTVIFDDDPLQQFQTVIFAQHVLQLRTAVNAVRALSGSAAFAFTDSSLAGLSPKPAHVQELRDALNQARQVLGLSTVSFAEPVLSSGTPFRASHLMEVRGGVR